MKKLLAILMTVAMIVGAFTFSVSAADAVQGTNQVVGTFGNNKGTTSSINDGVASFDQTSSTGTLVMTLTSQNSRYAIDVEFGALEFTYGGENIWDVNEYEYIFSNNVLAPEVKTTVSVVNHSDKRVDVKVVPEVSGFLNNIAMISLTNITANSAHTISASIGDNHIYTCTLVGVTETADNVEDYVGARTTIAATFEPYETILETKTWEDDVLPAIQEHIENGKVTLGTITVTVSMN